VVDRMCIRACRTRSTDSRDAAVHPYPGRPVFARKDAPAMTGKTRRNKARRKSVRDRRAARRIAVILHAIGITPKSSGRSWTEVLNGLRAQYASMTVEQKIEAHAMGEQLIREMSLDALSGAIDVRPSQLKPKDHPSDSRVGKGISPQKCDRCWSWGPKSIWNSREAAEAFCAGEKDPKLNAYLCPHGKSWHVGHRREQNKPSA